MSAPHDRALDRRRFLREAGGWALGLLAGAAAYAPGLRAAEGRAYPAAPLPGACVPPGTDAERTLAAVLDTVVPGPDVDPLGAPGALEACGLNLMLDDAYPFRSYAPLIATLMDQTARQAHGKVFVELAYEQRLEVLVLAEEKLPLLRLAYRAIRSAFYGGAYNGVGLDYLGYPGPNLGYRHLPDFSFRRPVCREASDTGWLP
jgi:hypothetical protein